MRYVSQHIAKTVVFNGRSIQNPKRPQTLLDFQYVTIHDVGNQNSKETGERAWLDNPSNFNSGKTAPSSTGWHIVVGETQIIEAVPTGLTNLFPNTTKAEVSFHAGNRTGNRTSIGIELIESGNRDLIVQNAVLMVAQILHFKKWGVERLKQHFDWSGKNCPWRLRANNGVLWNKFIVDVQTELNKLSTVPIQNTVNNKEVVNMTVQELMRLAGNSNLKDWEVTLGKEAVEKLGEAGIVSNPELWVARLGEEMPSWLVFVLLNRILEKK